MVGDPVGDFIVRLTNGSAVHAANVSVPFSNLKLAIAEKLKEMGFVKAVEKKGKKVRKILDIALVYDEKSAPAIQGVRRMSKPGRRMYKSVHEIVPVRYGHGALVLSTPKGIKTDKEARKENVGGETLFEIW